MLNVSRKLRGIFLILLVTFSVSLASRYIKRTQHFTIGISEWNSNHDYERNIQGFKDGLREQGFIEGKNIRYLLENPKADFDRQVEIIESFVEKKVDLIYSLTTPGTLAAKSVTKDIPIVFSMVTYPEEVEIIKSLSASGNNLVGTRNYVPPARQYFYFEKVVPHIKTLAFVHRKNEPNSSIQFNEFYAMLYNRNISVVDISAISVEDIYQLLEPNMSRFDALYLACDTLIQVGGDEVVLELSRKYKKPTLSCFEDGVVKGALMGNVTDFYAIGKMSGGQAALVLRGFPPMRISTESTQGDHILLNSKTAEQLNMSFPKVVLEKAAKIIP